MAGLSRPSFAALLALLLTLARAQYQATNATASLRFLGSFAPINLGQAQNVFWTGGLRPYALSLVLEQFYVNGNLNDTFPPNTTTVYFFTQSNTTVANDGSSDPRVQLNRTSMGWTPGSKIWGDLDIAQLHFQVSDSSGKFTLSPSLVITVDDPRPSTPYHHGHRINPLSRGAKEGLGATGFILLFVAAFVIYHFALRRRRRRRAEADGLRAKAELDSESAPTRMPELDPKREIPPQLDSSTLHEMEGDIRVVELPGCSPKRDSKVFEGAYITKKFSFESLSEASTPGVSTATLASRRSSEGSSTAKKGQL